MLLFSIRKAKIRQKFDKSCFLNTFAVPTSPDGGIGRRAGLKIQWPLKPCGFDSRLGHEKRERTALPFLFLSPPSAAATRPVSDVPVLGTSETKKAQIMPDVPFPGTPGTPMPDGGALFFTRPTNFRRDHDKRISKIVSLYEPISN